MSRIADPDSPENQDRSRDHHIPVPASNSLPLPETRMYVFLYRLVNYDKLFLINGQLQKNAIFDDI